jgi:hypothetical protein
MAVMPRPAGVLIHYDRQIEVAEYEEPREPEVGPPERRRDPIVQVIIIGRRRVVGYYRRPFFIVVVVYHL